MKEQASLSKAQTGSKKALQLSKFLVDGNPRKASPNCTGQNSPKVGGYAGIKSTK